MKHSRFLDALEVQTGRYSHRKVPQFSQNQREILSYLYCMEEDNGFVPRDEEAYA